MEVSSGKTQVSWTMQISKRSFVQAVLAPAVLALLLCSARAQAQGQEPSSRFTAPSKAVAAPVVSGPAAALRDVLSAACSQDDKEFAHYMTARNAESFDRLTPAARVALMKRFVLLEEPGKASVSVNVSGRPSVQCQTAEVTTEMKIGGADVRENVAFLPLEVRNASDENDPNVHQVTMGMVREDGQWKVLSLGLLMLDLPSLEVEWDAAEIEVNEKTAIESLKQMAEAIETYRRTYTRLPDLLNKLGRPTGNAAPGPDAAGLLDPELVDGKKNGYEFRYVILGASTLGAPAKFDLAATPITYGRTGRRSFFRDDTGVLHGADHQGVVGSGADPEVK